MKAGVGEDEAGERGGGSVEFGKTSVAGEGWGTGEREVSEELRSARGMILEGCENAQVSTLREGRKRRRREGEEEKVSSRVSSRQVSILRAQQLPIPNRALLPPKYKRDLLLTTSINFNLG